MERVEGERQVDDWLASALGCGLSRSDAMRFFKRYLDVERLTPAQRRLARRILRKSARIARHERREAWAPPGRSGWTRSRPRPRRRE